MAGVDRTQWIALYRKLEKPLYNVVYRWLWDAAESQDVVQEAFLRCWERRARVRADGVEALLYRTALNLASNRRRRRSLWRYVGLEALEHDRHTTAAADSIPRQVREAIDALPDALKRVLLLNELAGMSYREIARILHIEEGTVGSRRTRAIAKLRETLGAQGVTWDEC